MSGEVTFSGDDLYADGWRVQGTTGLGDFPQLLDTELDLYARAGVYIAGRPRVAKRQVRITLLTTRQASQASLQTALLALQHVAGAGVVRLGWAHRPGQAIDALVRNGPPSMGNVAEFVAPYRWQVTLDFDCPDPYWEDIKALPYALSYNAPEPIPVGSAPVAPYIRLWSVSGTIVDPYVAVLDATGAEVSRLTFTGSFTSSSSLEIDVLNRRTWTLPSGAARVSAASYLASGYRWPILDPAYGNPKRSFYPFLKVGSASGSVAGEASLKRRWI